MADDWKKYKIQDAGRVITGKTPPSTLDGFTGGFISFVTPTDMDGRRIISDTARKLNQAGASSIKNCFLPENSVLVSCIGSDMGKTAINGVDCYTNQQINSIIVNDKFDYKFIYYSLLPRRQEIRSMGSGGSAQPILNKSHFSDLAFLAPLLEEQQEIAQVLGSLDDKIELNRRMNETLEAMARAIFKSWFVDFDPVRAKANGQQPPGLSAEIADLFPDSFEDSPLGDIPAGWEVKKLGDVVGFNKKTLGKDYPHDEIEYVDISSVTVGKLEGTTRYSVDSAPSRARRLVSHGDTIWSTVRPNRKSYLYIHSPIDNLVVSTGFAVMTPEKIPPAYLYSWVTTQEFVDYLTYNADGSAYPAVRVDRIADADVLLPPPPVLNKFQELVGNFLDKVAANDRESITLAEIRDTLLPKLLSGEIRVGDLNGGGAAA